MPPQVAADSMTASVEAAAAVAAEEQHLVGIIPAAAAKLLAILLAEAPAKVSRC
jgi:hypothetical protein